LKTKHSLYRIAALLMMAVMTFAAACGDDGDDPNSTASPPTTAASPSASPEVAFPYEVERSDGKTLTLDAAAERIVSLSPGATEIIYAIGAEASLAAVDKQADYPEAAASFEPKVDAYEPNIETIAALEPDLVIVASDIGGVVAALDALDIPALFIDLDTAVLTIDAVLEQIHTLGHVTGRTEAADSLYTALEVRIDAVVEQIGTVSDGPTVYHELDSTYYSASQESFIGNLYVTLGARNIAGDGGGSAYPQLTNEAIIAANPQIIVLADEEFGVTVDSVKSRPGWDAIDAVTNGRIYGVDPDIISRPGPRIVDALELLAKAFYPEAFE
jgi:iron complex transport system substrate-binding protein